MRFEEEVNTMVFQQDIMDIQQERYEESVRLMEMEFGQVEIREQEMVVMETKQFNKGAVDRLKGFNNLGTRKEFIHNNESSIYGGTNGNGERVYVFLNRGEGMDVKTYQKNGWIQVSCYDKDGWMTDDMIEGRWDR